MKMENDLLLRPQARRRWKPVAVIAAIAVLVAAGVWYAAASAVSASQAQPNAAVQPPPLEFAPVDIAVAEVRELAETLPLTGTLKPADQTVVKAQVAGEVRQMLVREGDAVSKGQILARIDATDLQARFAEREAALESARAQLALAERNRQSHHQLVEKGFISQNAFANVHSQFEVNAANVRAQQAQLAIARNALEDAVVRAPMDGVISARHAQPGEKVAVDSKLLEIADLATLELEAAIPAADIAKVKTGDAVSFRVDGFGERAFIGGIERINPTTQAGTRAIVVHARVGNPDRALKGGMFGQGEIRLGAARSTLVVPAGAARQDGAARYLWLLEDGRLARRQVTLGASHGASVEVISGLKAGERIVIIPIPNLQVGAPARIAAPQPGGEG